MPRSRPLVLAAAGLIGAALAVSPPAVAAPAAPAAVHHAARLHRAVALALTGRRLTVSGSLLATRTYTVTGALPTSLTTGSDVVMRLTGDTAADVRVQGHTRSVSFLAPVTAAARRTVTVTLAGGVPVEYRTATGETLALPSSGTLTRGSEALITIARSRAARLKINVARAAGRPVAAGGQAFGVMTALTPATRDLKVLTDSGLSIGVTLSPRLADLAGLTPCRSLLVAYRSSHAGLAATMVAVSNQAPSRGCAALRGGSGFVTEVAADDRSLTVRAASGQAVTLHAAGRALRRLVDAVSVTDYVTYTYGPHAALATLTDTSASDSGEVTDVSVRKRTLTVRASGRRLKLRTANASALRGLKVGDRVDVDFYRRAQGGLVLVNCDDEGPAVAGGNGGGRVGGGSGGSGGADGSGGAAGSSGSAGGWSGSFGAAG